MCGNFKRENREILLTSASTGKAMKGREAERLENATGGTANMNVNRKSDGMIVPTTSANKDGAEPSAESIEESVPAKRNAKQAVPHRTPSRKRHGLRGLFGVREAARKDSTLKFTALLHHVNEECLHEAFFNLKKTAAVGIDEVTWHEYERNVEANIADLHGRVHRGAYRAKPSKRIWLPKPDGRKRPIGIAALEDKIVQQAVLWVLQSIYEQDFLGFSYGFRPGQSQHNALDALHVALTTRRVNWVLDADISGFFDAINHDWLIKFLEHRIGDRRVIRLVRKWLRAGVSEDGEWSRTTVGTPQGAVISPLLANVYLHYVFDLWIDQWRKRHGQGDIVVVRYADDFVIGFQSRHDAEVCLKELQKRFAQFGLKLHETKTRLIEFGRFAAENRKRKGQKRPETFDFLGFTHLCARRRSDDSFTVHRRSIAKRMRATLKAIRAKLRKRLNRPLGETGRWLRRVVQGWMNYHAVPHNIRQISRIRKEIGKIWLATIRRRSQRGRSGWTWERMKHLLQRYIPPAKILHPYPSHRFHARLKARAV
jgi:group II intron reverse transcriptase/maturase